jgi:hypothetical protein
VKVPASTLSLFLPQGALDHLRQTLAAMPWLRDMFDAQRASAAAVLASPIAPMSDVTARRTGETHSDAEYRWYGEGQASHRAGAEIVRLSLVARVDDDKRLTAAAVRQMEALCAAPTDSGSPFQDLTLSTIARAVCIGTDLLAGSIETPLLSKVHRRLAEIGEWLEYYLLKGGNGARRNHDLICACQLGLVSLSLGDAAPTAWAGLAMDRLRELTIERDVYLGATGDWYEGSLRYQLYILQWLDAFALACRNAGWADLYKELKLERFFRAIPHFLTPDGHNLGFNDTAHDEAIQLGVWPMLRGAAEFGDGTLLTVLRSMFAKFEQVLIPAESFLSLPHLAKADGAAPMLPRTAVLRTAGVAVTRTAWTDDATLLAMSAGPHSSHHHLSHTGIEYYWQGRPVLLECGVGHYVGREHWLGPEMHNVVAVDGGYRPKYAHPLYGTNGFDFVPKFDGKITALRENSLLTFMQGDHARMARVAGAVRNCWLVDPGYLLIEDRLEVGDGRSARFDAYFHGHGEWNADPDGHVLTLPDGGQFDFSAWSPQPLEIADGHHPRARDAVGVVMSGGEIRPPARLLPELAYLRLTAEAERLWLVSTLIPRAIGMTMLSSTDENGCRAMVMDLGNGVSDHWLFQPGPGRLASADGLETDGRVAMVRVVANEPVGWFQTGGRRLAYAARTLVESPLPCTSLGQI